MASEDLLGTYQAKVASLYEGSAINGPDRIEIGAVDDLPQGNIDFGIVKTDGTWTIPEQYASVAEPILSREAYLAGFPDKARASKSIQHACNWFAFKEIADGKLKRKFYDLWMVASMQGGSNDVYAQPPVLMLEYDKAIETSAVELHEMLLRFTNDNERLLQHQFRIDVAETWGLAKAIEALPTPDPVTMAILHGCGSIFLATAELPQRQDVITYITEHPLFASIPATRITKEFARATRLFYCQYQFDVSWIGKKFVHLAFTPSPRFAGFDWNALFSIPGAFVRLNWYQGDLLGEARGGARSAIAWFLLPASAVGPFIELVQAMHGAGMFAAHDVLVGTDILITTNYNTYIGDSTRPRFTIDPVRDDPELFLSNSVELAKTPAEASVFLETVVQNRFDQMRRFIDRLNSSFTIIEGRHDAWYQTLAKIAGVNDKKAAKWVELLTRENPVLIPEARTNYLFHPTIPVAIRMAFFTPSLMNTGDRLALARAFPMSSSVKARAVNDEDVLIWNVLVPQGQVEAAIDCITSAEPSARVAMHFANLQQTFGTLHSLLQWFDGTGYEQLNSIIETCKGNVGGFASGSMSAAQFRRACHDPAQTTLDRIERSFSSETTREN